MQGTNAIADQEQASPQARNVPLPAWRVPLLSLKQFRKWSAEFSRSHKRHNADHFGHSSHILAGSVKYSNKLAVVARRCPFFHLLHVQTDLHVVSVHKFEQDKQINDSAMSNEACEGYKRLCLKA